MTTVSDSRPLILVVDDEPSVAEIVSHVLQDEGYRTTVARDGRQALEAMHQEPPALVLLDLMMPRLDGHAVVERMADSVHLARVPVLVLTGVPGARVRGPSVVGVLRKPVTMDALVQRVAGSLHGKQPMARRLQG